MDLLVLLSIGRAVVCEDGGIPHSSSFFAIFHGGLHFLSKARSNLQSISSADTHKQPIIYIIIL